MIEPLSRSRATAIRALHRRKGREQLGCFLVEGERAIREVYEAGAAIRFGFAERDSAEYLASILRGRSIGVVPPDERGLFATESPQGIGAVVEIPEWPPLAQLIEAGRPLLALDGVADPGNVGTIIRTADWFGISTVILLPGTADAFSPKASRASMGSNIHLPCIRAEHTEILTLELPLYSLDMHGTNTLGTHTLPARAIYVIGSEAHGVSDELRSASQLVRISGRGRVESLNAAVAAAVLCYEIGG